MLEVVTDNSSPLGVRGDGFHGEGDLCSGGLLLEMYHM